MYSVETFWFIIFLWGIDKCYIKHKTMKVINILKFTSLIIALLFTFSNLQTRFYNNKVGTHQLRICLSVCFHYLYIHCQSGGLDIFLTFIVQISIFSNIAYNNTFTKLDEPKGFSTFCFCVDNCVKWKSKSHGYWYTTLLDSCIVRGI